VRPDGDSGLLEDLADDGLLGVLAGLESAPGPTRNVPPSPTG
jgi:hypothetical protein